MLYQTVVFPPGKALGLYVGDMLSSLPFLPYLDSLENFLVRMSMIE